MEKTSREQVPTIIEKKKNVVEKNLPNLQRNDLKPTQMQLIVFFINLCLYFLETLIINPVVCSCCAVHTQETNNGNIENNISFHRFIFDFFRILQADY